MLGKLLKYEFRVNLWAIPCLAAVAALLYGGAWFGKWIQISQISMGASVGLLLVGIAALIVAFILAVLRYYKGLFGAEGYLSQTLPVGKGALLASKLIVALVWLLLGGVVFAAAMVGFFQLQGILEDMIQSFRTMAQYLAPLFVWMGITLVVQTICSLSEIYFAITLAHTRPFLGNPVIFSILFYFAGQMVVGILELAGILLIPMGMKFQEDGMAFVWEGMLPTMLDAMGNPELTNGATIGFGSLLMDLAAAVVFLMLCRWLMMKKASVK